MYRYNGRGIYGNKGRCATVGGARTGADLRVGGVGELVRRGEGPQLDVVARAGPQRAVAVRPPPLLAPLRPDRELLYRRRVERVVRLRHLTVRRSDDICRLRRTNKTRSTTLFKREQIFAICQAHELARL